MVVSPQRESNPLEALQGWVNWAHTGGSGPGAGGRGGGELFGTSGAREMAGLGWGSTPEFGTDGW